MYIIQFEDSTHRLTFDFFGQAILGVNYSPREPLWSNFIPTTYAGIVCFTAVNKTLCLPSPIRFPSLPGLCTVSLAVPVV